MKKISIVLAILLLVSSCNKDEEISLLKEYEAKAEQQSEAYQPTTNGTNNPVIVWQSENQPNPLVKAPAIFYPPHQDDETLGMGASIVEHVRIGRPVYVVLLTNGANKGMLAYLKKINPKSTMQDVITARNNEFIAACIALGVHRVYIANAGQGFDESMSLLFLKNNFKNTMSFMRNLFPLASHKTISGNCDSSNRHCHKKPAHQAAANAIHELYNLKTITDVRLYRVYYYYQNTQHCDRRPSWLKPVKTSDKLIRQKAINEYKYINHSIKRYGLAYWQSVPILFDNSWNSNYEYVDFIENDY